jgi:hypothetical protein
MGAAGGYWARSTPRLPSLRHRRRRVGGHRRALFTTKVVELQKQQLTFRTRATPARDRAPKSRRGLLLQATDALPLLIDRALLDERALDRAFWLEASLAILVLTKATLVTAMPLEPFTPPSALTHGAGSTRCRTGSRSSTAGGSGVFWVVAKTLMVPLRPSTAAKVADTCIAYTRSSTMQGSDATERRIHLLGRCGSGQVPPTVGALAPDGDWIWQEQFGWVWSPDRVPVGWRPYSSEGHWAYTDDGWFWESELPWGWATFHYGRWYHSPEEGWLWVPGSEWAPAWVEWRRGDGYLGWAPLPPRARFDARRGLAWQGDREIREPQAWSFVPEREFLEPRLEGHIEYEPRNVTLLMRTRPTPDNYAVVDRRVINRGPDVVEVARFVGRPVRPRRLEDAPSYRDSRRQGEALRVYRPRVALADRPRREPPPPHRNAGMTREEFERRQRERAEEIDRYEAAQRRALADRQAREEREARAEQRAEMMRRHEQERREQEAESASPPRLERYALDINSYRPEQAERARSVDCTEVTELHRAAPVCKVCAYVRPRCEYVRERAPDANVQQSARSLPDSERCGYPR